jgi:HEPN domain-containing protein
MWLRDLEDTVKNAKDLRDAGFYDVATLYIQLAVEKALKAAIAALKGEEPPKVHNLMRLYSKVSGKLILNDDQIDFLRELTSAAYDTRYMDVSFRLPREIYTKDIVDEYMEKALPIIEHIKSSMKAKKNGDKSINNGR